ncbi:MAG TPA: heme-binding protein [Propionibacteriaceae bacterium]|nr:heme-binding protein [Propionibacteriaceae bacterium]
MNEDIPSFDRFDHDDAWRLGCAIVEACRAEKLTVTVCIRLGEQRVFHVGLPGSSADLDNWIERKSNVVTHFGESSMAVSQKFVRDGDLTGFWTAFGLSPRKYFPSGGALPLLVGGALAGVVALSGVDSPTEHRIALTAMTDYAAQASR